MTGRTRVSHATAPPTSFGATLRRMRLERGLRQRDLAGDDISPSYISFLESGRRAPTERVLRHLAERLGCDLAELRPPAPPGGSLSEEVRVELRLAWVAFLVGQINEAERRFQQIDTGHPGEILVSREARFGLARVRELTGRSLEAAQLYEECLTAADDTYQHWLACTVGALRCLAQLDDHDRALEAARRARSEVEAAGLGISDVTVEIYALIAGVHTARGNFDAARDAIGAAMALLPQISDPDRLTEIYWQASLAAHRAGMAARALELAERIAESDAGTIYAHTMAMLYAARGALLLRQEDPDPVQAQQVLTEAVDGLRLTGTGLALLRCRLDLVRALVMSQRWQEADELAAQIVRHPATPPLERIRARLLGAASRLRAGDVAGAREACQTAGGELETIPESPQTPRVWTELGEILAEIGDAPAAVRAYRRATRGLAIDPLLGRSPS